MSKILQLLLGPVGAKTFDFAFLVLRVAIGILTVLHGVPKIMGGIPMWQQLGTFVQPMGINFFLVVWGFLGAVTEFFGGMMLVFGLGTRIASIALVIMMIVAYVWHVSRGDSFNQSSFPLSLIFVFLFFLIVGSGKISIDSLFLS